LDQQKIYRTAGSSAMEPTAHPTSATASSSAPVEASPWVPPAEVPHTPTHSRLTNTVTPRNLAQVLPVLVQPSILFLTPTPQPAQPTQAAIVHPSTLYCQLCNFRSFYDGIDNNFEKTSRVKNRSGNAYSNCEAKYYQFNRCNYDRSNQ